MILDTLVVIESQDEDWLTRLRPNHFVWLVKEREFATIAFSYEIPGSGCFFGQIGLEKLWICNGEWGTKEIQKWFISPNGKGMDGSPLLLPVKDNLPDEPTNISETWVRQTERILNQIIHRLEQLEALVDDTLINLNRPFR